MLLLACCCLLLLAAAAAKPGRSTLDTKKGYKTKTGSTSSVTLTLNINVNVNLTKLQSQKDNIQTGSLCCANVGRELGERRTFNKCTGRKEQSTAQAGKAQVWIRTEEVLALHDTPIKRCIMLYFMPMLHAVQEKASTPMAGGTNITGTCMIPIESEKGNGHAANSNIHHGCKSKQNMKTVL